MTLLHEDSVAGGADISGDSPPVSSRNPAQRQADVARAMNHRPSPTPKATPSAGKEQAAHGKSERTGGDPSSSSTPDQAPATQQDATQPAPAPSNPLVPVDWKAAAAQDPFAAHQHAKSVAFHLSALLDPKYWENIAGATGGLGLANQAITDVGRVSAAALDPAAISQSVKNIWDSNTAQDQIAKWVIRGVTQALPPAQLASHLDQSLTGASQEQATADVAGQGLSMTANPINAVMPEKLIPQLAIYAAPNVVQALASPHPDQQTAALTWAAITGTLLSAGHMGGLKGVLSDALGRWPQLEKMLDSVAEASKAAQTKAQDKSVDHRLDWIPEALKHPVFPGSVVNKAPAATATRTLEETVDVRGQIVQKDVTKAKAQAALKQIGVESRGDLENKIIEGQISPSRAKAIEDNWTAAGFHYDLNVITPGDLPLRDPLTTLKQLTGDVRPKGVRALTAANAVITQMSRHLTINDANPTVSLWRSLVGHARGTDNVDRSFAAALLDLAGHVDGNALSKALEGDQAAYDALPAEGQLYADTWRLVSNEERLARQAAGIPNAVGNYLWRVPVKIATAAKGARGTGGSLTHEAEKSRLLTPTVTANEAGDFQIALTQRYESVTAANKALSEGKQSFIATLTNFGEAIPKEWQDNPQYQAIRQMAGKDPQKAIQAAQEYANLLFRPFETNAHRILARGGFGRQIKSLHTAQAIAAWKDIKLKVPNPAKDATAPVVDNAVHVMGSNPQVDKALEAAGYSRLDQHGFGNVLVHPELAKLLKRATQYSEYERPALMEKALQAESIALRAIMYNPAVHGWNVAGRFLNFAGMHAVTDPMGLATSLFGGTSDAIRTEAINAGVVNHGRRASFLPDLYKQMGDALGEHDLFDIPVAPAEVPGHSPEVVDLAKLGKPQGNFFSKAQNLLWTTVDDFATLAYQVEKHSAMASGLDEASAVEYAAKRANSWAGYVAPEDTNPMIHDGARLAMFAPAFWRTWQEIFIPYYRNSGVTMSPTLAKHMAKQEIALVASTVAMSYVLNNTLNYITSGGFSSSNEPQNQFRLEIRRPEMIRALQAAHYPGADKIDPITGKGPNGEVLTIDDPLTRFQKDVAGAAGLSSGHPDYQARDTVDGLEQFIFNRSSPFFQAVAGMGNVDMYQTIKDHQLRGVDPASPGLAPTPTSLLAGLLYAAPNGSNLIRQVFASQNKPTALKLPNGATVPAGVMRVLNALPPTAEGLLWSALTGTNGPYTSSEKTRGQSPSDDEYAKYQVIKQTYDKQMSALDSEAAGGTITPAQWLQQYRTDHGSYIDQTGAFFMNAPEHAHGQQALTSSWEKTYQSATMPDGSLDPSTLAKAQAAWKASHSAADYAAVQSELTKNDAAHPMLGLYHKVVNGYLNWQQTWASTNGYDVNKIRSEASEYGKLYGDSRASAQYLAAHPDLRAYESAKKRQFEESPLGLMYGLFYQSSTVSAYMRARHLTATQVEQQAEAAS